MATISNMDKIISYIPKDENQIENMQKFVTLKKMIFKNIENA